jgi:hypothetical protein
MLGAALAGAAISAAVFVLRPSPPALIEPAPAATPASPAPTPEPVRVESPVPQPSRSRGRTDWLFFFKTGDRLARMGDGVAVGMVIRAEKTHTFPDGTRGPAYLVQVPEGGQRFLDADELERSARIE